MDVVVVINSFTSTWLADTIIRAVQGIIRRQLLHARDLAPGTRSVAIQHALHELNLLKQRFLFLQRHRVERRRLAWRHIHLLPL